MKVLFLSAEAVPYVKIGGLGDVAGSLPQALRRRGHEVRLMMPAYGLIDRRKWGLEKLSDTFNVRMDWRNETCQLWHNPRTGDRFITNSYFFDSRFQVYGCGDEIEQFVLFCRAALEACRLEGWFPDVIHANDWHTAAAIRLQWASERRAGLVFTIHNMAHQGNQYAKGWPLLGVYDGKTDMNLMQQAIYCSDVVTTVSPSYAREIVEPAGGFGLDGDLRAKGERLIGVLNGIDVEGFDPGRDRVIAVNYSAGDLSGKVACKRALQEEVGLSVDESVPLIGMVSRLDFQKGVDLVMKAVDDVVRYSNAQLFVLGSGNASLEYALREATRRHPGRVANYIGYNADMARRVYAASDIFLMPSLFEPCGLSQMIAMRYGALPVVRAVGGLRDTVSDVRSGNNGCGYLFNDYNVDAMKGALFAAFEDYNGNRAHWQSCMRTAMQRDFSWDGAAAEYERVYNLAVLGS